MKSQNNILIAFILNLGFSIFELIGGIYTNSVAILSDSIHDLGDAISIGVSYFLEKKSKKKPDNKYTYGYIRYSIIGSLITTFVLIFGSLIVIYNGILRIINPVEINQNGMILFAIVGVVVNIIAVFITREGKSLNQRSVNLHMLEDVLGWIVVLIGSIIIKFTHIYIIDSILSIAVGIFILISAFKNLKVIVDLFLEKTPDNINIDELKTHILKIDGIIEIHHIHIRSIDGINNYATMHVVSNIDPHTLKRKIKEELEEHGISHSTLEFEREDEVCNHKNCEIKESKRSIHHHH